MHLVWLTSTLYQLREWLGSGVHVRCSNYLPNRKWLIATFLRTHRNLRIFPVSRQHLSRPFLQFLQLCPAPAPSAWRVAVLLKLATEDSRVLSCATSAPPGRKHLTANLLRRGSTSQSCLEERVSQQSAEAMCAESATTC